MITLEPSGLHATEKIQPPCVRIRRHSPVSAFQICAVPSSDPVITLEPSGLHATDRILALCPVSVCKQAPVAASQIFAVPSKDPVITLEPSGLHATDQIWLLCFDHFSRESLSLCKIAGIIG